MKKLSVKKLVTTALLLALLIAVQQFRWIQQFFVGQYISGTLINAILIVAAVWVGLIPGIAIGILSPLFALLITPGPMMQALPQLVPVIMLGNTAIVVCSWVLRRNHLISGMALGSLVKAAIIWGGVSLLVVPLFGSGLPEPMRITVTTTWTFNQLITAFLGSYLVLLIRGRLDKAIGLVD